MKLFSELYSQLDQTTRTSEKVEAMVRYFRAAPPLDAAWAVYFLSGKKIGKAVNSRLLREWAAEASGHPVWLVDQSYTVVGDLSETLSLIIPEPPEGARPPALHEIVFDVIQVLAKVTRETQRQLILSTWPRLTGEQRLVFHKLLSVNFRVGVSRLLLIRALAEAAGIDSAVMAHRLSGRWSPDASTMARLLAPHDPHAPADPNVPYPFMLANPLADPPAEALGDASDWLLEWKWDGIRAQVIRRGERVVLWSRGEEVVTSAFPEIAQAAAALPQGTVLDGEILAWDEANARPFPFTKLQRRLNRQNVELTFWPDVPVTFMAFDLLEIEGRDVRAHDLRQRREMLTTLLDGLAPTPHLRLSAPMSSATWDQAAALMLDSRQRSVEGLMLKRWSAAYVPGRPVGLWWKLKVQPYTMDAVMIAAEPGQGRRAGLLSDYTFGVWDGPNLVPITKAYSGLTDEELAEADRFARRHTIARHGPVHIVEPLRVFEIGFEAIQASTRHKSGIAVRFPRILRQRTDKKAADADSLQTMRALLGRVQAGHLGA